MAFEGYGSIFDTVDSYGDTIAKGAFKKTLADWQQRGKFPKMLLQHGGGWGLNADDLIPVGKWSTMKEDGVGLRVKGNLFDIDTDRTKATYAALQAGELDGLSIGFETVKSTRDEDTGVRTLLEVRLWEVSLVTFPANDPARVMSVKAGGPWPSEREFERFLRDAGFSREQAKAITATGYREAQRDAEAGDAADDTQQLLTALQRRADILTGVSR